MVKDNSVIFKGRKDGIIIQLDDKADFGVIESALREKIKDAQKFFGQTKTSVTFRGRQLSEREELALIRSITESTDLNISFTTNNVGIYTMTTDEPPEQTAALPEFSETENMTHFQNGNLRSGQSIRYAGSVVLIGDVNPGAEIVADGNVVVLGSLRGMVHAGCSGNLNCYVSAFKMLPTQLRIGDIITYTPPDMLKDKKQKFSPVYAYIHNGQIYIAPIMNG